MTFHCMSLVLLPCHEVRSVNIELMSKSFLAWKDIVKPGVKSFLFLVVLFIITLATVAQAQKSHPYNYSGGYLIRHYTNEDYGSSSQVWSATSDERGIMFFGSNKHLMVYDGAEWVKYQARNKSIFRSLDVDSNNLVYAGSYNEFGVFLPDSVGGYRYESLSKNLPDSLQKMRDLWRTHCTSHGVYFASAKKIFRYYDGRVSIVPNSVAPLFAFNIDDILWFVDADKGLGKIKNGHVSIIPNTEQFAERKSGIVNIIKRDKTHLWLITQYDGILLLNTKNNNISSLNIPDVLRSYIEVNEVYTAERIDENRIALGTIRGGLAIVNNEGDLLRIIDKSRGLQTGSIYGLYADKFDNLWVLGANGIAQVFTGYPVHLYNENQGLDGYVTSVVQYEGNTYISTLKGLFYLPPYEFGSVKNEHNLRAIKQVKESCWSFSKINGQLFVNTSKGVYQIRGSEVRQVLKDRFVFTTKESKLFKNKVLIGLRQGMAIANYQMHRSGNISFKNFYEIEDVSSRILQMVETQPDRIWLGTHTEGLQMLTVSEQNLKNYNLVKYDSTHGLPENKNNVVPYIIQDELAIATTSGLYRPSNFIAEDPDDITFVYDTIFNPVLGPSPAEIGLIIPVNDTTYIVDSRKPGFLYLGKKTRRFDTGPFSRIRKEIANILYDADHKIINVCTPDAVYIFPLNMEQNFNQQFRPRIRTVTIGPDSIIFKGNYTYKGSAMRIFEQQTNDFVPEIDYNHNSLIIDYAPVFYTETQQIEYQYKMEGFDETYRPWVKKTEAIYTNLPEGTYVFKVRAKNIYGVVSSEATYKFQIKPPWYRTVLAYLLYAFAAILIFVLIMRLYTYALKKQNRRLEKMVKERTKALKERTDMVVKQRDEIEQQKEEIRVQKDELEVHKNHLEQLVEHRTAELKRAKEKAEESDNLKSSFLANMSHEIRTPLNAIVGYADLITDENSQQQRSHFMEMIMVNVANLLSLIDNIIDLARLETARVEPELQSVDPEDLLKTVYRSYLDRFKEKGIAFDIEKDTSEKIEINTDPNRVEQVFMHLVDNALKYTENGKVILGVAKNDAKNTEQILFYVSDTGIGMSKEGVELVFKRFTKLENDRKKLYRGAGIGLALSQKIVHLLGGEIWIESAEGEGTTVYFTLPEV